MILLQIFFVFVGSWWKFFRALKAWIHRASPIYGLLRFLEAFELDSNVLWDPGRWFGWFLFKCYLYSKLKFLKFFEASRLGSNRVSGLLNLSLLQLSSWISSRSPLNALGRLLFIGVWGWVSDVWWSLIGDTCHSLIGLLTSSLTRAGLLVSSLTRARLLVSSLTCVDVRLVLVWHLANFYWFLSSDSKT